MSLFDLQQQPFLGSPVLPPVAPPRPAPVAPVAADPFAGLIAALIGRQPAQHTPLDFSAILHPPTRHLDLSGNEIHGSQDPWANGTFKDRNTQLGQDAWTASAVAGSKVPQGVNTQGSQATGATGASPVPFMPSAGPLDPRLFEADPSRHDATGGQTGDPNSMLAFNQQLTQPGGYAALLGQLVKKQPATPEFKKALPVRPPRVLSGPGTNYPGSMVA